MPPCYSVANHDVGNDCHVVLYHTVFAYGESDQLSSSMACMYSSRTNTWVSMATIDVAFDFKPPLCSSTPYIG
uniref:Uncharacterized protein n=1 Tax=Oryza punctata TaxID=4537 RepID=A0A0E0M5D6_ORYPU